jgi:hypothetical protein
MPASKPDKSFKKEFKRQLRMALTASIGFTIAYAWRNVVFDSFHSLVSSALNVSKSAILSEIYTSITLTFIGVIAIFITSKLLK